MRGMQILSNEWANERYDRADQAMVNLSWIKHCIRVEKKLSVRKTFYYLFSYTSYTRRVRSAVRS